MGYVGIFLPFSIILQKKGELQITFKHILLVFYIWGGFFCVMAQDQNKYILLLSEEDRHKLDKGQLMSVFRKEVKNDSDFDQFMHYFYEMGYLLAAYEIKKTDSSQIQIQISLGELFSWAELDQGNLPDEIFLKTGFRKNIFINQIVNFNIITRLFKAVINYSENHGYPFARIRLTHVNITDKKLNAMLDYDPGPLITFDHLRIGDDVNIKPKFLEVYLNIKQGMVYDQRRVDRIFYLINQLAFVSMNKIPDLTFVEDMCRIQLNLKSLKSNTFDGIIGLLPNENEPNKLLITGQIFLGLDNLFRSGKRLNIEWQKPNVLTQELLINYHHPALFKFPLNFLIDFSLFKQDTSFINRDVDIQFMLNQLRFGQFGFEYSFFSSRLLNTDHIINQEALDVVDSDINYYGISYKFNSLDRFYLPTRGFLIESSAQFGTRKVIKNAGIDSDYYQGLLNRTIQIKASLKVEKYYLLFSRNVILTRLTTGYINNDQLFFNDLFRIGGLNTLRGFNEKNFYASWYFIGTFEYRYLFENSSQFFVFFDGSGLGYDINNQKFEDYPFGLGAGFSLSTKAGLLNIIYALGKSQSQPFNLDYSKIHIGYSNRF